MLSLLVVALVLDVESVFLHLIEDLVVGHFALVLDGSKCLLLAPY
jgi:hypothetical protein